MKPYRIILAIILIVGLTAFFSPSTAKQASDKSPVQSKTTKSNPLNDSEKMKKVQPLKMELVRKGNKLYLKLNREAKGLWLDQRRKGAKSLGKGKFIEVTPYLSRAKGGRLTFVVVDTTGQIHTRKLPVSKYVSLLKSEKPKSSDKKKPSKTIKKQPGKEVKRVPPQPMVKQPAKSIIPKPDLKIEDLKYVAKRPSKQVGNKKEAESHISFWVKNVGKGKIDRHDFNKIPLSIKINGRPDRSYTKLSQLVKYKNIKDPGGMQRCIIPEQLGGRTRVEVDVNANDAIDELRKENNRVSMLLGGPWLPKSQAMKKKGSDGIKSSKQLLVQKSPALSDKELKKTSKSITAAKTEQHVMIRKKDKDPGMKPGPMKMSAKLNRPEGQVPEAVPLSYDYGIRVVNPTAGDKYYQGETIYVLYEITNNEVLSGNITFRVISMGTGAEFVSVTIPASPVILAPLVLREDMPLSRYFIDAYHSESSASGQSDIFEVRENSARIDFSAPARGDEFHPGGTMDVNYQLSRRVEPGTITFELWHDGAIVATQMQEYLPGSASSSSQPNYKLTWNLPSGLPDSDRYTILATHPRATGIVSGFSIRLFPDTGTSDGPYDFQVMEISVNTTGEVYANIHVTSVVADYATIGYRVDGGSMETVRALLIPPATQVKIWEWPDTGPSCSGNHATFEVTVDPDNHLSRETDETNNTLTKTLSYFSQRYAGKFIIDNNWGESLSSGETLWLTNPLGSLRRVQFTIKNCGYEAIRNVADKIEIRQSGQRLRSGGLGYEDFDEKIPINITELNPGDIKTGGGYLIANVDSTITITFSGEFTEWEGLANPFIVNIDFE